MWEVWLLSEFCPIEALLRIEGPVVKPASMDSLLHLARYSALIWSLPWFACRPQVSVALLRAFRHQIGTAHYAIDLAIAAIMATEEQMKIASPASKPLLSVRTPWPNGHFFSVRIEFLRWHSSTSINWAGCSDVAAISITEIWGLMSS